MTYRDRPAFQREDAETVHLLRKVEVWFAPLNALIWGFFIFSDRYGVLHKAFDIALWLFGVCFTLWLLCGAPSWELDRREQRKVDDEWHRLIRGDACIWGVAAVVTLGAGMMLVGLWLPLDDGRALFALVNGGILTTVFRYAWLNRDGSSDGDE